MASRRLTFLLLLALFFTLLTSVLPLFLPARGLPGRKARDPGNDPALPIWELWSERALGRDTIAYWRMQSSGLNLSIPIADFERDRIDLNNVHPHLHPRALADLDLFAVYTATGWPLRALSCSAEDVSQSGKRRGNETWRISSGILLQTRGTLPPRILPLRPIWSGLIINTLLYAVVFGAAFAVVRATRRRLRVRRNRCPSCGYPRVGLASDGLCPECGQPSAIP